VGIFYSPGTWEQEALEEQLYRLCPPRLHPFRNEVSRSDSFGRLEGPRLNLSVMVMEGVAARTLRLGAGHFPGTQWVSPRTAIVSSGHCPGIQRTTSSRFTSLDGSKEYPRRLHEIVGPKDTYVLKTSEGFHHPRDMLSFLLHWSGTERFIVQATKPRNPTVAAPMSPAFPGNQRNHRRSFNAVQFGPPFSAAFFRTWLAT